MFNIMSRVAFMCVVVCRTHVRLIAAVAVTCCVVGILYRRYRCICCVYVIISFFLLVVMVTVLPL